MLVIMLGLWVSLMSYCTLFVYQKDCISSFYLNLLKCTYALWLDSMLKVLHLCLEGHWHQFSGEWLLIDMVGDLLWYLEQLLCSYISISLFLPSQDISFPMWKVLYCKHLDLLGWPLFHFQGCFQHSLWFQHKLLDGNFSKISSGKSKWVAWTCKGMAAILIVKLHVFTMFCSLRDVNISDNQAYISEVCREEHQAVGMSVVSSGTPKIVWSVGEK